MMSDSEEINFKDVISGEQKIQYVDQLENLREKLNSGSFLKSRSSKKELIGIVENLIDILPVEMRTARWLVREQETFLNEAKEESQNIVNNAKRESENLISNSYVLQEAVVEANTLIKQAEKESQAYRIKIEDEMDTLFTELQTKIEQLNLYITNEKNSLRKPREIIEPE
jgi:F0F1-type ATP synthase membrane subunit b/b'